MRKTAFVLAIAVAACSLCGCMSKEEKKEAMEDIKLAKPLIESYLSENYSGARITEINYIGKERQTGGMFPDLEIKASGFCIAEIENGDDDFKVIVNTENGECWDNIGTSQLKEAVKNELCSMAGGINPDSYELNIFDNELDDTLSENDIEGFFKKSADSNAVLKSGGYAVVALFKTKNKFPEIDSSAFTSSDYCCSLDFGILNPNDTSLIDEKLLDNYVSYIKLKYNNSYLHRVLDTSYRLRLSKDYKGGYKWESPEYCEYETKTVGDFTFAWKSTHVTPSFKKTKVISRTSTDFYSGDYFDAVTADGVEINYKTVKIDENEYYNKIYFWTDYKYAENYVIGLAEADCDRKDQVDMLTIDVEYNRYKDIKLCEGAFDARDEYDNITVTMGIYKRDKDSGDNKTKSHNEF